MPHPRKFYIAKRPYLISSRVSEGLPLVATQYMTQIIESIMARASRHYKVKICHYIFMGNHFHLLGIALNADDVSAFVGYVKKELAEAVKRLQGTGPRRIWEEGYDSPILLTPTTVIKYITYLYTNPQAANLVERIDEYPGASSWQRYMSGDYKCQSPWIRRSSIPRLPSGSLRRDEDEEFRELLVEDSLIEHSLTLEPDAWMECFSEIENFDSNEIKAEIVGRVRKKEKQLSDQRTEMRTGVLGASRLSSQSIYKRFRPKKWGRRMVCLSDDIVLRREFLTIYKSMKSKCFDVYQSWKAGDYSAVIPAGMLSPRPPVVVSCLQVFH